MAKSELYGDKEIATDLLIDLKHMKALYNTFTQECSNESLYKEIDSVYTEVSEMQRCLFELMKSKKWYVMEKEEKTKVSKAYTKMTNCLNTMK